MGIDNPYLPEETSARLAAEFAAEPVAQAAAATALPSSEPPLTPSPTPLPSPTPAPTPEPTPPPPAQIVVSFIGDCTLGGDPGLGQLDIFRGAYNANGPAYFFSNAFPYTGQDDLTIVNLEGPLTMQEIGANKTFAFRGDVAFAEILSAGGVEAVSLANNHTEDYGAQGYSDTLFALEEHGILAADAGRTAVYEAGDWKIGIAAAKFPMGDRLAQLEQDIAALRGAGCHTVVVMAHWGEERVDAPDPFVRAAAHAAIDAGADLVAGHHPHILQGIEVYKGRVIAYSLGNFVFGGNRDPDERETAILQQRFRVVEGRLEPDGFRVIPFTLSGTAAVNDYRPVELSGADAQVVYDAINRRGALLPHWVEISEGWREQGSEE